MFIDLEKVFDSEPSSAIEWALRRQLVPEKLMKLVMVLYEDARSSVAPAGATSAPFHILVRVHRGFALSPILFKLVMEEATKERRSELPRKYSTLMILFCR